MFCVLFIIACQLIEIFGDSRIVHGKNEKISNAPFTAALAFDGKFVCSATILNRYWLLTACHCFDHYDTSGIGKITVSMGSENWERGTIASVDNVYCHPSYKQNDNYDLAMLSVSQPIQFNSKIYPIEIETKLKFQKRNTAFYAYGWSTDSGDSGGPLVNAERKLIGISSKTEVPCESVTSFNYYVNVPLFSTWIVRTIQRF